MFRWNVFQFILKKKQKYTLERKEIQEPKSKLFKGKRYEGPHGSRQIYLICKEAVLKLICRLNSVVLKREKDRIWAVSKQTGGKIMHGILVLLHAFGKGQKRVIYLVFFLLMSKLTILAQTASGVNTRKFATNHNGWFMYTGQHKLSHKTGLHLESQFRRSDVVRNQQQLLLRTGLNYHVHPSSFVTLGYCFVETNRYGGFPVASDYPEHRIWEQWQFRTRIHSMEIINRYRLEQRFMFLPESVDSQTYQPAKTATYQNRIRLMTRASFPLNDSLIRNNSLYCSVYNEVFLNFGKSVSFNYIDQNRAYIALGYVIPRLGRLEIGYMNQLIVKPDGIRIENNHTLQVGIFSSRPFYRVKSEQ